ncbi:trypsin [Pilimelia terevasa]|uniref:Trypsin n=1 Tax=Pilimelia terevasa TaxID=53372 RepID=A0A8J3BLX6_9ACTN|nr:serine protease [Pilimelia terevasa]GGK24073.1 trypsin [Pilimelia terevasa]
MRRSTLFAALAVALTASAVPMVAHAGEAPEATPSGQTRIVGGKPAAEGQFPWAVKLSVGCGGTIVSPDIVISAQHCFSKPGKAFTAYMGKIDWAQGEKRAGSKYKVGGGPEKGDWAVLKLDSAYTPAAYPVFPSDDSFDAAKMFRAAGWGAIREGGPSSKTLLYVDVPLVADTDKACSKAPKVEICAGDLAKGGIDTCQGDSGGPLVASKTGDMNAKPEEWVLVGMTSWGRGCARPNEPGHYAQLTAHRTEILNAIKELGGQAPVNMG